MRLHLVPVGLSVLDHLQLVPDCAAIIGDDDAIRGVAARVDARSSAEIDSLRAQTFRPDADGLILIASDTAEGVVAAKLVVALLGLPTGRVVGSARPIPALLPRAIVRVQGLDPRSAVDFEQTGVVHLAHVLRHVHACAPGDQQIHLHLSGGFKATIPYLHLLAEVLAAMRLPGTIAATILWEGGQPVTVPLRPVDLGQLREELDGGSPRQPRQWVGVAYRAPGDLVAFGSAIKALSEP